MSDIDNTKPHVVIHADDVKKDNTVISIRQLRVQIHFSEPITEFMEEDIVITGATLASFSMLREDYFLIQIEMLKTPKGQQITVQVPECAAKRKIKSTRCTNSNNSYSAAVYSTASNLLTFHYVPQSTK
jgi:hypothetical protein